MSFINFTELEIDAIGEILNISLGSSATAISTLLESRVDITTPVVKVVTREEFEYKNLEPAVGVEITYVSGLTGSSVMVLKRRDVKTIVEMLMRTEIPEEEFELDAMNLSAICEVMNQMMGASSTALSEFLSRRVNISTPVSFEINNISDFKDKYFIQPDDTMVVVGFTLKILDKINSEFISVMTPDLAKELVKGFLPDAYEPENIVEPEKEPAGDRMLSQEEIEKMMAAASRHETVPEIKPEIRPESVQNSQDMNRMMQQMQEMMEAMHKQESKAASEPKLINVQNVPSVHLKQESAAGGEEKENMELILGVPLDVSVEIGRTRKTVKDILEFSKGSLVVLDRLAGEQVDLFVNGHCIAKGDVVVVEDNFGIRITEIVKRDIV
ncbi:flagellar motor switch phosphatase FliY [Parasporobacterium paucivorans]|uniref:Flagellar motor switch protein FliN/FliY n=1 Tax=Parasporobacterium paucivorans DSM 15970 TaxID=1122934 RepID=A0A1M6I900_9FIRM|nr:flagellar motor switch phosphatase FliY [Parasporobacterium paucivorans]SHJ30979.1 flagellar motor switch protein FliN/FliY [Parasporobacterium paucivorans DSM 15970]